MERIWQHRLGVDVEALTHSLWFARILNQPTLGRSCLQSLDLWSLNGRRLSDAIVLYWYTTALLGEPAGSKYQREVSQNYFPLAPHYVLYVPSQDKG